MINCFFAKLFHYLLVSATAILALHFALFTLLSRPTAAQTATPQLERAETPEKIELLTDLPQEKINIIEWMKHRGWESYKDDPSSFEVGNKHLHLVSQKNSIWIGTKLDPHIDPYQWSRLRFRLRVEKNPTGTNLYEASGRDSAFRLYVVFKRGWLPIKYPTIEYTWSEKLKRETFIKNPSILANAYNLVIGNGVTIGDGSKENSWVTIERDILKDYHSIFFKDKRVPPIVGIGLKCDSNDTKTVAEAWMSNLELIAPKRAGN